MARVVSENIGFYCQHYPKLAAIVTAHAGGEDNVMTIDWHTSISLAPPLYGICLVPGRFTYELIINSREFGINFLPFKSVELVVLVGTSAGRLIDKFEQYKITKEKPIKTNVPILQAAYAAYECKLVDNRNYGDHNLLVGEIVAVHEQEEAFDENGTLILEETEPIMYIGREQYLTATSDTLRELH